MKRISVFFATLLFCCTMWGQSNIGRITGSVTDPAGKAIAGAKVTATDPSTGVAKSTKAEVSGLYVFPSLRAGTYSVTAEKPGFVTWIVRGVVLDAASTRTISLKIAPGSGTHEVAASELQVESTGGSVGGTIDNKKVDSIGMNGRNFQSLLSLLPGTSAATTDTFSLGLSASGYNVNGVRGSSMLTAVDGISLLDPNTNSFVQSIPNPETISEMRVLASSYSAENPSLSGAYVNIITKTGTKQFHGSVFEFIRNDAFDAKSDFATVKQPLHFNDFGGTFGAPIYIPGKFNTNKSKLFFFMAEEWKFNHKGVTDLNLVPTTLERQGIFSPADVTPATPNKAVVLKPTVDKNGNAVSYACPVSAPTGSACIPTAVWGDYGQAMVNIYPVSNGTFGSSNYSTTQTSLFNNREDRYNLDYVVTAKTTLSARYTHSSNHTGNPFGNDTFGIAPSNDNRPTSIGSANVTHFFSPTTMNTASIAVNAVSWSVVPTDTKVSLAGNNLPDDQLFAGDAFGGVMPKLTISGGWSVYGPGVINVRHSKLLQFSDDFTSVRGKHVYKFGVMLQKATNSEKDLLGQSSSGQITFATSSTLSSGNAEVDALLGNFSTYTETSAGGKYTGKYYQTELYAQDTWKVSSKLGLEYGVRYIIPEQVYNPYGGESAFVPSLYTAASAPQIQLTGTTASGSGSIIANSGNIYDGISLLGSGWPSLAANYYGTLLAGNANYSGLFHGLPNGFTKTPMNNFAPRVGLAYDPFGTGKTVIRAGAGFFYVRPTINTIQYESMNLPFLSTVTSLNTNMHNLPTATGTAALLYPQTVMTNETSTHKTSLVTSLNLGIQSEVAKGTVIGVGYVGTLGQHLPVVVNLNQYPVGTLTVPTGSTTSLTGASANTVKYAPNALRPYVGFGDIGLNTYSASSNYHSLQTSLKHMGRKGLGYGASYTFSKTMESSAAAYVPQNSYNPKGDYGLSDIHHGSILSSNAIYDLPFFSKGNRIVSGVLGHWSVATVFSYQSGVALNIALPSDNAGQGSASGLSSKAAQERPNLVGNPNKVTGNRTTKLWFNTAAVATPQAGTYGNAKRNELIGPYYLQEDMSATKRFTIEKKLSAEIKADCFNLYNHDSYTTIATTVGAANFGSVTATVPGRVFQLAMKVKF